MLFSKLSKSNLVKTGFQYSIASTFYSLSTMLIGFCNMRWIGPELLGIWQSVAIVNSYIPFFQLGIQSALNVELPKLLGAKKDEEAINHVKTSLAFAVILSVLFSVISLIWVVALIFNNADAKVIWGAVAVSLSAIFQCYQLQFIATYRSANAFDKLTRINYIRSVVTILSIGIIYLFNYYGLLFYNVFVALLSVLLMWYYAPYRNVRPHFIKKVFINLLGNGVVLSVILFISATIETMPRLLLLHFGSFVSVGLFSPALVVGQFMDIIPNQISQFLHPQLGYKYGQTGNAKDMWDYLKKLTIYVPILMLPIVLAGWLCIPYLIEWFFPKYTDSISAIKVMMIGFMFSTRYFSRGFLSSIRAYKEYLFLLVLDVIMFAGIPICLILKNPDELLLMLAIGLSVSYFLSYYINIIVVHKVIFSKKYNKN